MLLDFLFLSLIPRCADIMWTETHCSVTIRRLRRSCRGWWRCMWRLTTRWGHLSHNKTKKTIVYCPRHSAVSSLCLFADSLFPLAPEFTQWPADVVRRSGPSHVLPPAACSSHTELTTWGARCGAGETLRELFLIICHACESKSWGRRWPEPLCVWVVRPSVPLLWTCQ